MFPIVLVACLSLAQDPPPPAEPAPPAPKQEPATKHEPATAASLAPIVRAAIDFMVHAQNPDGSWGSHESPRPIEVLADVPGSHEAFLVATTALSAISLADAAPDEKEATQCVNRALAFLLDHFDVKRASGLEHYNVWSFGYTLQFFGEWMAAHREDPRRPQLMAACKRLVEKCGMYQTLDGGWGYLSMNAVPTFQPSDTSMSFTTATILIGLQRAKQSGVELPPKLVERAVAEIERSRLPDGAFLYGDYLQYRPRMPVNQIKGSACRTPACEYALDMLGKPVGAEAERKGLEDLLIKHAGFQQAGLRRPIPHESWYQISGYFYLYGDAYAAYVLEQLPAEDQRRFWPLLADAVMVCHQPDGSFWDYPLYSYHKPYGTAFALIALSRAERGLQALSADRR